MYTSATIFTKWILTRQSTFTRECVQNEIIVNERLVYPRPLFKIIFLNSGSQQSNNKTVPLLYQYLTFRDILVLV